MAKKTSADIKNGGISVQIEHLFPIIKKWLYTDKEIFIREIVSNSCDAITKLKKLISLGEAKDVEVKDGYRIDVILDPTHKTISVKDNGIGMTADEIEKYLCQIALSGALDFMQKYESDDSKENNGIIGHFGLGFYSSFMVSKTVDVISKSYSDSKITKWTCDDGGDFSIEDDYKGDEIKNHGTVVIMHINSEGKEYLDPYTLKNSLMKYCDFMPYDIYFHNTDEKKEEVQEDNTSEESKDKKPKAEEPINDTHPLWQKAPNECTDDEYDQFYIKVFKDYRKPLFHIHLNADYPLNFKGILFFPKITNEYQSLEGQVKLYYNQVFVADNIKEIIPEYLLMLRGVLDCPELPLNVSRSDLQTNSYVNKVSNYITKKVADTLNSMFKKDRPNYEKIWPDIKTFVEYGSLKDQKFNDRLKDSYIYEKTDGSFITLNEYLDKAQDTNKDKVYYTTNKTTQAHYIKLLQDENISVIVLDKVLDTQYISSVESANEGVKFVRVDGEAPDAIKEGDGEKIDSVEALFKPLLGEKTSIEFQNLKDKKTPAILLLNEDNRRIDDMMKLYAAAGESIPSYDQKVEGKFIINSGCPLIKKLALDSVSDADKANKTAKMIYSLALISQRSLSADELDAFLSESYDFLNEV